MVATACNLTLENGCDVAQVSPSLTCTSNVPHKSLVTSSKTGPSLTLSTFKYYHWSLSSSTTTQLHHLQVSFLVHLIYSAPTRSNFISRSFLTNNRLLSLIPISTTNSNHDIGQRIWFGSFRQLGFIEELGLRFGWKIVGNIEFLMVKRNSKISG